MKRPWVLNFWLDKSQLENVTFTIFSHCIVGLGQNIVHGFAILNITIFLVKVKSWLVMSGQHSYKHWSAFSGLLQCFVWTDDGLLSSGEEVRSNHTSVLCSSFAAASTAESDVGPKIRLDCVVAFCVCDEKSNGDRVTGKTKTVILTSYQQHLLKFQCRHDLQIFFKTNWPTGERWLDILFFN